MAQQKLTGDNLKQELWSALLAVKSKRMRPEAAQAIASQSREIMRVVKTEMELFSISNVKPTTKLIGSIKAK